jgi:hypothetical protein
MMTQAFEINEESFRRHSLTPPANAALFPNASAGSDRKSTVCDITGILPCIVPRRPISPRTLWVHYCRLNKLELAEPSRFY